MKHNLFFNFLKLIGGKDRCKVNSISLVDKSQSCRLMDYLYKCSKGTTFHILYYWAVDWNDLCLWVAFQPMKSLGWVSIWPRGRVESIVSAVSSDGHFISGGGLWQVTLFLIQVRHSISCPRGEGGRGAFSVNVANSRNVRDMVRYGWTDPFSNDFVTIFL